MILYERRGPLSPASVRDATRLTMRLSPAVLAFRAATSAASSCRWVARTARAPRRRKMPDVLGDVEAFPRIGAG